MSDLAPFVATVLRDRAMVEMIAEMEKLKRLVDERLKVQITGRKGSPVYFEGSLKDGYTSHRGRCFEVMFDGDGESTQTTQANSFSRQPLKLAALNDIEIRLGGAIIQRLDFHNVIGSCNAPFFTNDDFYRDAKYNKPIFIAHDRKEIVLKVKTRHKGPVPFVVARFGKEMNLWKYRNLHQLDMWDLKTLSESRHDFTLILDGLTFSKRDIKKSLSVLEEMEHIVDKGNSHCQNPCHRFDQAEVSDDAASFITTTKTISQHQSFTREHTKVFRG